MFSDTVVILASGKSGAHATSAKRSSSLIRPTSPKSPVASASAFESIEGSDDEDNMTDNSKIDTTYLHTNGKAVSQLYSLLLQSLLLLCFIVS